jgi:hypothetical protein
MSLLGKDGSTKSQDGGKVGLSIAEIAGISAGAGALLVSCIVVVVSNVLKKRKSTQMLHARPRGQKNENESKREKKTYCPDSLDLMENNFIVY